MPEFRILSHEDYFGREPIQGLFVFADYSMTPEEVYNKFVTVADRTTGKQMRGAEIAPNSVSPEDFSKAFPYLTQALRKAFERPQPIQLEFFRSRNADKDNTKFIYGGRAELTNMFLDIQCVRDYANIRFQTKGTYNKNDNRTRESEMHLNKNENTKNTLVDIVNYQYSRLEQTT